jgi:NTP pyrophosphatase (non-canonical NTP hydrolase)
MELNQYQELAMRTNKPLATTAEKLMHAALGCGSEVGEFAMASYKMYAGSGVGENAIEELGDIAWYIACLCDAIAARFESLAISKEVYIQELENEFGSNRFIGAPERHFVLNYYAGEIQTIVKANVYYGKEFNRQKLMSAAAMVVATLNSFAEFIGSDLSSCLDANIAKLTKRYPNKFTEQAAIERADKV